MTHYLFIFVRQKPKRSSRITKDFKNLSSITPYAKVRGQAKANSTIIAIGGGKGGVGKSFISTNISIFLANMGFNTVLVDLDLGAPNVHTCLGEALPSKNFHDFLENKVQSLNEVLFQTQIPKLKLITGANDHRDLANISLDNESRLMSALFNFKSDFIVLDLSAGTHTSTLDFFLMADHQIVTLTPDPTSIENAYRFMKAAFFRKMKRYEQQLGLDHTVLDLMKEAQQKQIKTPADLLKAIENVDLARGQHLRQLMNDLNFQLILNQARSAKDLQLGQSIETVCKRYFGVKTELLGGIDYDNSVWHALRKRRPLLLEYPHSPLYAQLLAIARDLSSPYLKKAVI